MIIIMYPYLLCCMRRSVINSSTRISLRIAIRFFFSEVLCHRVQSDIYIKLLICKM